MYTCITNNDQNGVIMAENVLFTTVDGAIIDPLQVGILHIMHEHITSTDISISRTLSLGPKQLMLKMH